MRFFFRCLLGAVLLLSQSLPATAMDITTVRVLSPSWQSFTNPDGTGLYFDLLGAVFSELYGIQVQHEFAPSLRSTHLVAAGEADIMTCKARVGEPLVMSTYPMYENAYYVFFNKENIGQWQGRESLKGRSVVWRISYYDDRYIPEGMETKEVKTGTSALGMVVLGRMDFYLDDLTLIRESIKKSSLQFDRTAFETRPVGFRSYHPVFNRTERGQTIRKLYDEGMLTLHRKGVLAPIYKKWGHPVPRFDAYTPQ